MRYCPNCAAELEQRMAFGRLRPVCPQCGFVGFRDPKVAAGVLVERGGRILLTRRAHDPGRGLWGLPAGYMEWDERVEDAAVRETLEETGLRVRLERLVGVYSYPARGTVLVVYAASIEGGELCASDESEAVEFFAPDDLPPLAFDENARIIADWSRKV
jgi:ADP-ribose pyrophosphatase YjhB (NUDIX family)